MKKFNYTDLVKQIERRNKELEALQTVKAQEKSYKLMPRRINSKTIVLTKCKDDQYSNL